MEQSRYNQRFNRLDRRSSWLYLAVAFLGAVALWYTVNAREQVERVVEVRLDYKGLPPGLIITSGQLNKISVRLRGPLELLRSLSNRELAYTLDLSSVTVGSNVIPLTADATRSTDFRAYQALEVIPSRLNLEVDRVLETRLPVEAKLRDSPFTSSLKLTGVQIQPDTVAVRGPSREVSKLQKLLVEVPVHLAQEGHSVSDEIPVVAPPSVEVLPAAVTVRRTIEVQRRVISLQRDVIVDNSELNLAITPSRVSLRISIPSSSMKDSGYLAQIQASIDPESALPRTATPSAAASGSSGASAASGKSAENEDLQAPVKVSLPQGARLISVNPEKVRVKLE